MAGLARYSRSHATWKQVGFLIVCLLNISQVSISHGQPPHRSMPSWTKDKARMISDVIAETMACNHVMGASVAVVLEGRVELAEGFGFASYENEEENVEATEASRFCIGSLSKSFTATLVGILLDESNGRYTWDTTIRDVMGPSFQFSEEWRTQRATIRDLLAHKMALAQYGGFYYFGFPEEPTLQEMCRRLRFIEPAQYSDFRQDFMYHNLMYMLASCIAEKIGGDTYENLMREKILRKLDMEDSVFLSELSQWETSMPDQYAWDRTNRTFLKVHPDITLKTVGQASASGGLCSAATDMAQWLLLQTGADFGVVDRDILDVTHSAQMTTGQKSQTMKPFSPFSSQLLTYGFGWYTGSFAGYNLVAHSGAVGTFSSRMTILPDVGLGIYMTTNTLVPGFTQLWLGNMQHYIAIRVLDEDVDVTARMMCPDDPHSRPNEPDAPPDTGPPNGMSSREDLNTSHQLYVGTYGHLLLGNVSVFFNDSTLWATVGRIGLGRLLPSPEQNNTFMFIFDGMLSYLSKLAVPGLVSFSRLEDGKFQEMVGHLMDERTPPVFKRDLQWDDLPAVRATGSLAGDDCVCAVKALAASAASRHGLTDFTLVTSSIIAVISVGYLKTG